MRIDYRMDVRCTPRQLWSFLDDAEKQKLWLTTLVEFVPTSALPRAAGTTFDLRVREGRRVAVISMVTRRGPSGFEIVACQNTDRVEGADTHVVDNSGFRPASYRS